MEDFATSLDLKDTYHHSNSPGSQKVPWVPLQWGPLTVSASPVWLIFSPWAFCRVLAPVVVWCHLRGIRLLAHLDDWLLLGSDPVVLAQQTNQVHSMLCDLGWLVSEDKSQLTPLNIFPFIGAVFDPTNNTMLPSTAESSHSVDWLAGWATQWITARDMMEILGHLASLIGIIPLTRLHMRGLQMCLLWQWRAKQDSLRKRIFLDQWVIENLQW